MTLNTVTKRLEKLTVALDGLRGRMEALTKDMSSEAVAKPRSAGKAKSNGGGKRTERPSAIGATINYGGLPGKVIERKGSKFLATMSDGKNRYVSAVYVYRQLGKKAKPAKVQVTETGQQQEALQAHQAEQAPAAPVPVVQEAPAAAPVDQPSTIVVERAQKSKKQKVA